MDNILEVRNIRKEFKEFKLDDVSLAIPKGYIVGLIGPNGAGKTTTIKIMMNMLRPDAGEVEVFGMDYRTSEKKIKNRIGYVGEEQYFYEDKKVGWTGDFVAGFYERWDKNAFDRLLGGFGISRSKKIRELSKGMRVKLSLAMALSHGPDLFLLDEPTSGLDPVVRREILGVLQDSIEGEEKSVLISSHITDDISRIADYVAYMVEGRVALFEEKDSILANWKRIHFKKGSLNHGIADSLTGVSENVFGVSGITKDYVSISGILKAKIESGEVRVEPLGLDDVLLSLVNKG